MITAIVNQKGGVGKTTTATNLATALAACGGKTLLIDLDPQGNASTGFGITQQDRVKTSYDLLGGANPLDIIIKTAIPLLDLIASNVNLSAAELDLVSAREREYILKKALNSLSGAYDNIIIDCPPSLGLLTINALTAANQVLIPMQCEFYALEGLSHLLKTIELIKKKLNAELKVQGILLTMYDRRNKLTEEIEQDVRSCMKNLVFNTVIPRNIRICEAPSHGKPVMIYDHKCSGAIAYMHLAKEILERNGEIK
mgnify:CR=1 FL=1